jgi:hypothetical protein
VMITGHYPLMVCVNQCKRQLYSDVTAPNFLTSG